VACLEEEEEDGVYFSHSLPNVQTFGQDVYFFLYVLSFLVKMGSFGVFPMWETHEKRELTHSVKNNAE
jgi:hypothetical protein